MAQWLRTPLSEDHSSVHSSLSDSSQLTVSPDPGDWTIKQSGYVDGGRQKEWVEEAIARHRN